jgi:hypothetical protein
MGKLELDIAYDIIDLVNYYIIVLFEYSVVKQLVVEHQLDEVETQE